MFEFFKGLKRSILIYAFLLIVLGIILIFYPTLTTVAFAYFVASLIIASGITQLITYFQSKLENQYMYNLIFGVLLCCVGVFMFVRTDVVIMMIPLIVGVFIVFNSINAALKAFRLKAYGYEGWFKDFIMAIILAVAGFVIMINPFTAATVSVMFIGAAFVYAGILDLYAVYKGHKVAKDFNEKYLG